MSSGVCTPGVLPLPASCVPVVRTASARSPLPFILSIKHLQTVRSDDRTYAPTGALLTRPRQVHRAFTHAIGEVDCFQQ